MTQMVMDFLKPETQWAPPTSFPDLTNQKEIAIDLETCDPWLRSHGPGWACKDRGHIIGIAIATEGWKGYFPVAHSNGANLDKNVVRRWLQKQLDAPNAKIFHNAQYDVGWLLASGIKVHGTIVDTMIAGALIDENRYSYALNSLSKDYLGELKAETELMEAAQQHGVDPKGEMWKLPAEHVGFYAEQDARLTFMLWQRFKVEIHSQNLDTIWQLEQKLLPSLIEMRMRGIRVDVDKAVQLEKEFVHREKDLLKQIKKLSGVEVDIWAARQIGHAFDKLGIDYPKTPKSGEPSFTQGWLTNSPHDISKLIVQAREINKFHGTFINSILKYEHKGRIHGEIKQLKSEQGGTVSGRLAMSNPNLQQLPARSKEFGPVIRGLFLPEQDCQWGSFDYSQQEPRIVVHYASSVGDGLGGSRELTEAYQKDDADFHQTVADLVGIDRKSAKTIGLGLMYGMGKNKLGVMLGVSNEKAHELIDMYNKKVPFVKELSDMCMYKANNEGVIRTKLGRKCRFDMWETKDFGIHTPERFENASAKYGQANIKRAFTYKALNRLIQGSAADQTKQAVVDCVNEGFVPLLQIHDELCFNIESQEQVDKIKNIMETCVELKVPSKVDVALGQNFGDAS